jgi:hypothetical protein
VGIELINQNENFEKWEHRISAHTKLFQGVIDS